MKQILKYVILNLQENLKFAESKHSIALALASGIIIFGSTFLSNIYISVKIFASMSIILCSIAILFSTISLASRNINVNKKIKKYKKADSLLYFADICSYDAETYLKEIIRTYELPEDYKVDGFDFDLAKFIIATAKVIEVKHSYFSFVVLFLFGGVMSLIFCCLFASFL